MGLVTLSSQLVCQIWSRLACLGRWKVGWGRKRGHAFVCRITELTSVGDP